MFADFQRDAVPDKGAVPVLPDGERMLLVAAVRQAARFRLAAMQLFITVRASSSAVQGCCGAICKDVAGCPARSISRLLLQRPD